MKIAIHHREGSFSDRWINYCKENEVDFKVVNAYNTDVIEQLKDCDALMWHHQHSNFKDVLVAKNILFALEQAGVKVFPDFNTAWHFDDKVAQKYLLEAISAPLVPSYVFYDKREAIDWASKTIYPKVFKLTRGTGSKNVKLVRNSREAKKLINTAFDKGFTQFDRIGNLKERYRKYREGKDSILSVFKGIRRLIIPTEFSKQQSRERGYAYFQEFIPNNDCDIRVIIIGEKAFAIKRMIRKNDFRASGSGEIIYDKKQIDIGCIKISFEINKKIKSQSIAFDFVLDEKSNPLVVEISYGFATSPYDFCPGYWTSDLNWHAGKFNPQEWMIDGLIKKLEKK